MWYATIDSSSTSLMKIQPFSLSVYRLRSYCSFQLSVIPYPLSLSCPILLSTPHTHSFSLSPSIVSLLSALCYSLSPLSRPIHLSTPLLALSSHFSSVTRNTDTRSEKFSEAPCLVSEGLVRAAKPPWNIITPCSEIFINRKCWGTILLLRRRRKHRSTCRSSSVKRGKALVVTFWERLSWTEAWSQCLPQYRSVTVSLSWWLIRLAVRQRWFSLLAVCLWGWSKSQHTVAVGPSDAYTVRHAKLLKRKEVFHYKSIVFNWCFCQWTSVCSACSLGLLLSTCLQSWSVVKLLLSLSEALYQSIIM